MFFVISQMLPGIKIMFSSILPTLSWRYSEDLKAMDDTRKRLNTYNTITGHARHSCPHQFVIFFIKTQI
jgi:hypothetical protein